MSDDDITVTVLIERKTGYREPAKLTSYETDRMPVVAGWACGHAVRPAIVMEVGEDGAPEPCDWCLGNGDIGDWQPIEVVKHEWCERWFRVDAIAAHIKSGQCAMPSPYGSRYRNCRRKAIATYGGIRMCQRHLDDTTEAVAEVNARIAARAVALPKEATP